MPELSDDEVTTWANDAAPPGGPAAEDGAAPGETPEEVVERAEDVLLHVANEMEEAVGLLSGIRAAGDYPTKALAIAEKLQPFVEQIRDLSADYMDDHGEMTQEERDAVDAAAGDTDTEADTEADEEDNDEE